MCTNLAASATCMFDVQQVACFISHARMSLSLRDGRVVKQMVLAQLYSNTEDGVVCHVLNLSYSLQSSTPCCWHSLTCAKPLRCPQLRMYLQPSHTTNTDRDQLRLSQTNTHNYRPSQTNTHNYRPSQTVTDQDHYRPSQTITDYDRLLHTMTVTNQYTPSQTCHVV